MHLRRIFLVFFLVAVIKHLTEAAQRVRIDFHSQIQRDRIHHGKEAWQQAAGCSKGSRRLADHIGPHSRSRLNRKWGQTTEPQGQSSDTHFFYQGSTSYNF